MRTKRARKEEILKDWINKITKSPGALYAFERAEARGLTPVSTFESARVKDLELMITLCVAAFNHGCDSTREHLRQLRKDREKYEAEQKAQPKLRVIGSQRRIKLEDTSYKLVSLRGEKAVLDAGDHYEEWALNDHHAGYTIEIDGLGFEFVTSYYEKSN